MEFFLNIYFYNFCVLHRGLTTLINVYLNPFVWFNNINKMKLGFKLFIKHMEKNVPPYFEYYKFNARVKIFFIPFLVLINCVLINLILIIFDINLVKNYIIILIINPLGVIICSKID